MKNITIAVLGVVAIALGVVLLTNQTTTQKVTRPPPTKPAYAPTQISGLPPCTSTNFFMQCAAGATGQQPSSRLGLGSFGVDSYGAAPSWIAANYDCSYLSGYPGGKDWTRAGLAAWHARGKATCVVWETWAARALYGYSAGRYDAQRALHESNVLGIPSYAAIRFAVDTETSAGRVALYFQGARSVLGSRTGAYGSYYVVAGLEARGLTTPRTDWQTLAWSYGNRGRACLYQSSINNWLSGVSVDFDHTSCANWGQFPYRQTQRTICFGRHAQGSNACRLIHAEVRRWQGAEASSRRAYNARQCPVIARHRDYFYHKLRRYPHVKTAYRKRALRASRRAYSGNHCPLYHQRVTYFSHKISVTRRKYS